MKKRYLSARHRCWLMWSLSIWIFSSFWCTTSYAQQDKFYDWNQLHEIKISFEQANWHEVLDSLKHKKKDGRLLATLEFKGQRYDSVGIRYKGNSSFYSTSKSEERKLPFNIKLDYIKADQTLPGGHDKLKLSNIFRDPSYLREVVAYEIVRQYMPASRANWAKLYINGDYLGLYNSTESVEDEFLAMQFADAGAGVLIKCDPTWGKKPRSGCPPGEKASLLYQGISPGCYFHNYEKKSDNGWTELVELTRVLNEEPKKLEQALNIDQALWMLAFNTVFVNLDSYSGKLCHNYYLYQDTLSGMFTPIVWDMNLCFGGFRYDGNKKTALSNKEMFSLSPFLHFRNEKRPLISLLLKNNSYRHRYVAHMRTLLKEQLENGKLEARIQELYTFIKPHVEADEGRLYEIAAFESSLEETTEAGGDYIVGLNELLKARTAFLGAHPIFSKEPPAFEEHTPSAADSTLSIQLTAAQADEVSLYWREAGKLPYQTVTMANTDETGTVFTATVPLSDKPIQYYFFAENEEAAALSPTNASWFYYEYKRGK